jgi:hypothetical protein
VTDATAIALAGAIGGPLVAVVAIVASQVGARGDRAHALQMGQLQQLHEARLAQTARSYEDRKATYLELLSWLYNAMVRVQLTEPIISFAGDPDPPEAISNEEWLALQARVSAFGSAEVDGALEHFRDLDRSFYGHVSVYRALRDSGDFRDAAEKMTESRRLAREAFDELRRLVREELAAL